jgi:hypothetical protein
VAPSSPSSQLTRQQRRALTRLFIARLFENDMLSPSRDRAERVFLILAALATPSVVLPLLHMLKYVVLPGNLAYRALLADRAWYAALAIAILTVATTLQWGALSPDQRDCLILFPLPVRLRSIMVAKSVAVLAFLAAVVLSANAASSILFPTVTMHEKSFVVWGQRIAAHGLTGLLASLFAFSAVLTIHSVVNLLLPWRLGRRIMPVVQLLVVLGGLTLILTLPRATSRFLDPDLARLDQHALQPALWFLGLHQVLLSDTTPPWPALANLALVATATALVALLALYPLATWRALRHGIESRDTSPTARRTRLRSPVSLALRCLARRPGERAMLDYTLATLRRSPRHRVILATAIAIGLVAVVGALPSLTAGSAGAGIRAVLLFVVLTLVLGARHALAVPAELRANWIFRVVGQSGLERTIAGTKKAVACLVVTVLLPLLVLHSVAWGVGPACAHVLFALAFAVLIIDLSLVGFNKVPFACSYRPGKANLRVLWFPYFIGLISLIGLAVAIERWTLATPSHALLAALAFLLIRYGIAEVARRRLRARAVVFDEQVAAAFQGLLLEPR